MGQRGWVDVAVTFLLITVATLEAQAPHTNGSRLPAKSSMSWLAAYHEPAARLIGEAVGSTFAWQRLALLTDSIGNRLSGSPALDRAIQWSIDEMKRDGLENVHAERVLVPQWVRGKESAEIVEPAPHAMAMLVRSVGPEGLRTPHTGALQYASDAPKIPGAAISTEDADRIQRMTDRGSRIIVRLRMEAHFEADAESANVVGEIRGREKPDEIVVLSGHLDSWDVGAGASDDGGGCVVTWEALRLMKKVNLRPRRTVRVVLFTNEENGGRGGLAYRDSHRGELEKHVLMLESDGGVFRPLGFGFTGNDTARHTVKMIATLLTGIAADQISGGGGGADIGPSVQEAHIPSMSLEVDGGKYFLIHHTPADTVDKIDPVEMAKCAAAVAVMAYVVADLPHRLGE